MALEEKLPAPSGPPRILKPSYELLGEVYLKAGKPILAMLNGEAAELIRINNCGITCKASDSSALASAALRLKNLSDEDKHMMGKQSLMLSKTKFDRTIQINQLESWLQQLAEKKPLMP